MKKLSESVWGDIRRRAEGLQDRKEDDIDNLSFNDFEQYLKDSYEVLEDPHFFSIGSYPTMGTDEINLSIPIEKKDIFTENRGGNRMLAIGYDKLKKKYNNIRPNKYVFELYPREMMSTFSDKFIVDGNNYMLIPKEKDITNSTCVNVIDKLLDMVERPLMRKK